MWHWFFVKYNKGGTIMEKLSILVSYKALTQVIVPALTFGFFPAGE